MSRFFTDKYSALTPYTPGEQPTEMKYIKLNTNESPFPPCAPAIKSAAEKTRSMNLYPDPNCGELTALLAEKLGVSADEVLLSNGSDEILNFAFMAFCDSHTPAIFPDITYGFYPVFAELNNIPYREIPLDSDFKIRTEDYMNCGATVVIANPNAPTGLSLPTDEVEKIIRANHDNIVIVDEAYVDFGGVSCIPLIRKYDNLLVCQTFSKSRSMAGARLGFGVGNPALIRDLNTIKYSTNPYNINSMTQALGIAVLQNEDYTKQNCRTIIENRKYTTAGLRSMGFMVLDSDANFIFAKHEKITGIELYDQLKKRGILVRHFTRERIVDFNRISIGTKEQMETFLKTVEVVLKEEKA